MYPQYYINQVVFYRFLFVVIFVFSIASFTNQGLNAQVSDSKWVKPAGVIGNDERNGLVIAGAENSYVVGRFIRIAGFSDSTIIGAGSQNGLIAKSDLNGKADMNLASIEEHIIINEVVTDPQQDWTDNSGGNTVKFDAFPGNGTITDTDEWLELYNAGVSSVDLTEGTGWTLNLIDGSDATLDFQNPGSTVFVFSDGGSLTDFQPCEFLVIGNPPGSMNNNIFLVLKNASGTIVDDVELGNDKEGDGDGDGAADGSGTGGNSSNILDEAIARLPNAIDTDNDVNDFIQQHATIGFTNDAAFDFSDAPSGGAAGTPPDSYPTLLVDNGARHVLDGTTFLGVVVDAEPDGQPDATATDDDTNGVPDDEDGVVFTSFLAPGNNATADVTASIAGKLNAWIDFNRDGDWEDANEHIFTNQVLNAGINSDLTYSVPSSALQGKTFARFRFNSTGDLSFDGLALDGEVEDYEVEISITDCFITPPTDTNQVNSQHSLTVIVQKDGIAQQGVEVIFDIFKGPNLSIPNGVETTDVSGQATFAYNGGTATGTDSIVASGTIDGVLFECFAQIVWVDNICTLEAETDTNQVGTDHSLTVTVKQDGVAKPGIPVTFEVFKGPNSGQTGSGTSPTDGSGQATFIYTSNGTVGTDSIKASATIDGVPFECFAQKVWVDNMCTLEAETDTNQVGSDHSLTITVKQDGVAKSGIPVTFEVFKGPNSGQTGSGTSPTDGSGQATFIYTSNGTVGTDSIKASGTIDGVPFECFAQKVWVNNMCSLEAESDTNQVGTNHSLTVTVKQDGVAKPGIPVTFEVFKGPNLGQTGSGTSPTNGSGQATFIYTSNGTVGTDSIKASGTIDGVPFECFAQKVWVDNMCSLEAESDTNQVGTDHSLTVTVKQDGVAKPGIPVTFEVFKGPNLGQTGSGTSPTNGSGQATFVYTSNGTAGTDSIKASGTIDGVLFECFAQIVWVDNICTLEAETDTNQVGTDHSLTVTVKQDGVAKPGIPVTFEVFKGPNSGQTGSGTSPTDGSGQATFVYTSNGTAGTDSIVASGTIGGVPFECFAQKVWVDNMCSLEAESDTNQVGTDHSLTVTVKQDGVVKPGIPVTFEVFKGPNSGQTGSGTSPTDGSGQATFIYTSNGTVGTDSIKASGTIDGVPFECIAQKVWVDNMCTLTPATDQNQIGTDHTIIATAILDGNPVPGISISFTIFKGPNVSGIVLGITDANGEVEFSYTGNGGIGTDSIRTTGEVNGVPFECLAEKKWVVAQNINDEISVAFRFPFFNLNTNQFQFEVKLINNSNMILFAPFFVEFETIISIPEGHPITVDNADRGGDGVGAVYDYSDFLGGDGQLDPGEMTSFKVWRFNDPDMVNFFIFANVFSFIPNGNPITKATGNEPFRFFSDVKNGNLEISRISTALNESAPFKIPTEFDLQQNYPNPFNPETTIRYQLPEASDVTLTIYNLQGQLVRILVNENKEAGFYQVVWDAKNNTGNGVPSGIYLYRIQAGDFTNVKKLTLLR